MLAVIGSTRGILPAMLVLMCGTGVMSSLVSLRLEASGVGAPVIGIVAAAYFVGLLAGSLRVPSIIARVGHIRAFTAVVSLLSASTLSYALYENALFYLTLRLVDGFCVAGVFVCVESWLNTQADVKSRGAILAAYMIAIYAGQAASQFILNLTALPMLPFVASSVLISLAALPIALTRLQAPVPEEQGKAGPRALYAASPLGIVGTFASGLMLSAFYALGAVYARRLGADLAQTALFMSVVIAGGVILQYPLGWLSDRIDRRKVIVLTLAGAAAVSLALAMLAAFDRTWLLLGLGAGFGGIGFALYPLCVAHLNDHLDARQRVPASAGLVMIYSAGAIAGPLLGSGAMRVGGPGGLFVYIGAVALLTLVFALWRQIQSNAVPGADQQRWQVLPRTTPGVARLDPGVPIAELPAFSEHAGGSES